MRRDATSLDAAPATRPGRLSRSAVMAIVAVWGAAMLYVGVFAALRLTATTDPITAFVAVQDVIFLAVWAAATPAILWSARRFPIDHAHWLPRLALHLILGAAFVLALNIVGPVLAQLVVLGRPAFDPTRLAETMRQGVLDFARLFHVAIFVYAFIVAIGHALVAIESRRAEGLRAERLRADLAEARLLALQRQLQPHFLFNALNSIGSLIVTGRSDDAFDGVGQLGDLLRAVLATERRVEVPIEEELEMVSAYLGIERLRFGERLRARVSVSDDATGALVPPMLLQPLVENAIVHGIARTETAGCVEISVEREGERLVLDIRDDGAGITASARSAITAGIGLENTRRRLDHLYGTSQRFELRRDDGWTVARVELPFHRRASVHETLTAGGVS